MSAIVEAERGNKHNVALNTHTHSPEAFVEKLTKRKNVEAAPMIETGIHSGIVGPIHLFVPCWAHPSVRALLGQFIYLGLVGAIHLGPVRPF